MTTQKSTFLSFIYTIFIGVLLATFVGVGIDAFYQAPKYPEYPIELRRPGMDKAEMVDLPQQLEYEQQVKQYQEASHNYNRNVSIISLTISVIILVISLTVVSKFTVIADGLLFGGVLVLIYSIIRGFAADNSLFRFTVVSISLAIALIIGFLKFIKAPQKE